MRKGKKQDKKNHFFYNKRQANKQGLTFWLLKVEKTGTKINRRKDNQIKESKKAMQTTRIYIN